MSIVIERVDQTEFFINESGTVTIKQDSWPEEPSIKVLVAALLDIEKEAGEA